MANLPTSLNIQQPNISDGSDLLRMAAMLSKEASDTADKAFTDFKSTLTTSANRQLASTFANGIASGLSPDEAFKQASGTINSWTSADAINAALQTRNAEKEAIIRENMDRRAEASENRQQLDWEGANKAAEANNLFNLAHATNNMNLFKQAEALTQGYDDITKKHVKPTEMAILQDSLATNAMSRARAKAELDKIKEDLLAKQIQARYNQLRANNPSASTLEAESQVAKEYGYTPEALELFALKNGLSMGSDTTEERTKANTASLTFTDKDQSTLDAAKVNKERFNNNEKELNSLLGDTSKLTEQQKKDREELINSLVPQVVEAAKGMQFNSKGPITLGTGMVPTGISSEQAKDFIQKYLQAPDASARKKIVTDFRSTLKGLVSPNRLNDLLKTNFTENPNGFLSFTPEASKTYLDAINSQDINGVRRDEVAAQNSLKVHELEIQKAQADNAKLLALAQQEYMYGDRKKALEYEQLYKANAQAIKQESALLANEQAIAFQNLPISDTYQSYNNLITGKLPFDNKNLKEHFGESKADKMMDTYYATVAEVRETPGLTLPAEVIKAVILHNPDETDVDEIIKEAKLIKANQLSIKSQQNRWDQYTNASKNVSDTSNSLVNRADKFK